MLWLLGIVGATYFGILFLHAAAGDGSTGASSYVNCLRSSVFDSDDDGWISEDSSSSLLHEDAFSGSSTNPATGLPMAGAVDVAGNPYGTDLHSSFDHHDHFSPSLSSFDSFSSHDSFSSSSSWDS